MLLSIYTHPVYNIPCEKETIKNKTKKKTLHSVPVSLSVRVASWIKMYLIAIAGIFFMHQGKINSGDVWREKYTALQSAWMKMWLSTTVCNKDSLRVINCLGMRHEVFGLGFDLLWQILRGICPWRYKGMSGGRIKYLCKWVVFYSSHFSPKWIIALWCYSPPPSPYLLCLIRLHLYSDVQQDTVDLADPHLKNLPLRRLCNSAKSPAIKVYILSLRT